MRFIFALLLPFVLSAQVYFTPSSEWLGPFQRIGVARCNAGQQPLVVSQADIRREAAGSGITVATAAEVLTQAAAADRRSWQRSVLLGIEAAGWLSTALIGSDLVRIRERWKGAIPVITGSLRLVTTAIQRPAFTAPDPIPSFLRIGPGECWEGAVYGVVRSNR